MSAPGSRPNPRRRNVAPMKAALLALALLAVPAASQEARPNIVLLFADDQRTDTISAWGNPAIDTPNLDRLTREGFSFRRAYCLGSPHGAVCVPSRAMLHTGRAYFGMNLSSFDGAPTLGEELGAAGYTTFATGKWHNGNEPLLRSFAQGRALYLNGMGDHHALSVVDLEAGEFVAERVSAQHSSELFADAAVGFLESYDGEEPFFLYASFTAPHDPRDPPQEYRDKYYARHVPLPANFAPQHGFQNGSLTVRDEKLAGWPRTAEVVRDQLAEYYGLVDHLDAQVGRILTALEARGDAGETLVVYAADHGLAMGSHGLLGKQSVYEHSLRAPLIVRGPGLPAGGASTALVYLHDLFPTLLRAAGVAPPGELDAHDLAPLWRGERGAVRESLFLSMGKAQRGVTDGRWKLIRYPRVDHTQLFDLASDPHEMVDLASRPDQGQRIAALRGELERWQARLGDGTAWTADELQPLEVDLTGTKRGPDRWQPPWIVEKYFGD